MKETNEPQSQLKHVLRPLSGIQLSSTNQSEAINAGGHIHCD